MTSPEHYMAPSKEEVLDVAKAKVCYSPSKAEEILATARRTYPDASIAEVSVGTDPRGVVTINGIPRTVVRSKSAVRRSVWRKYGGRCAYCGAEVPLGKCHMDEYYPKRGHAPDNLMPACDSCYAHKKGKTPSEFQEFVDKCFRSIRNNRLYKLAKRYGRIVEPTTPITFYYLRPEAQALAWSEEEGDKK